ncbi:hypothetical protein BJV82DRAFT_192425 [Fennellomyces sp. T-0311]|nr:hypothetical protein BJV82DRAFT_192425 [Fennellomyces sp. T-0311]
MSTLTPTDDAVITEADDQELSKVAIAIICKMHAQAGFINVDNGNTSPWQKTSVPPPETHDLVFSSILEHPPRAPASSHHTSTIETTMFEDGYERPNDDNDKILMSLARQEWTEQYRPSTPQQLHRHHRQRWSNNSSYHVW